MAGYVGPNKVTPGVAEYIDWVPLAKATLTDHSTVTFDGLSSGDFDIYRFQFVNIHAETDNANFQWQGNASGQTGFNETLSTIVFNTYQNESDSSTEMNQSTAHDRTQTTTYAPLAISCSSDSDHSLVGFLELYAPASTTYVKHFYARTQVLNADNRCDDVYIAGYINDTNAIDEISFKMSSGNFDGVIQMYGIA